MLFEIKASTSPSLILFIIVFDIIEFLLHAFILEIKLWKKLIFFFNKIKISCDCFSIY